MNRHVIPDSTKPYTSIVMLFTLPPTYAISLSSSMSNNSKMAMIQVQQALDASPHLRAHMVLQIHDEIIFGMSLGAESHNSTLTVMVMIIVMIMVMIMMIVLVMIVMLVLVMIMMIMIMIVLVMIMLVAIVSANMILQIHGGTMFDRLVWNVVDIVRLYDNTFLYN